MQRALYATEQSAAVGFADLRPSVCSQNDRFVHQPRQANRIPSCPARPANGLGRFKVGHQSALSGTTPLGRILIQNKVLRFIEPSAYLRILLTPRLRALFRARDEHDVTYGRIARIVCSDETAVELLEVVAPE